MVLNKKLRIHINLHKKCFSISKYDKKKKGWYVIKHSNSFTCNEIHFKVGQKSRLRCLNKNKRNVHAFAYTDYIVEIPPKDLEIKKNRCSYNPYKADHFYDNDLKEISYLQTAIFKNGEITF